MPYRPATTYTRPLEHPDAIDLLPADDLREHVGRYIRIYGLGEDDMAIEDGIEALEALLECWRSDPVEPWPEYLAKRLQRRMRDLRRPMRLEPHEIDRQREDAAAEPDTPDADLLVTMQRRGIAQASQAGVVQFVADVQAGAITNGYAARRALGGTRREAQTGAATAALLAAGLIEAPLPTPDRAPMPPDATRHEFKPLNGNG